MSAGWVGELHMERLDAAALGALPDALGDIHAGRYHGVIVRELIPREVALAAGARLQAGHGFAARRLAVTFAGWTLGTGLDHAEPDLEAFLDGVPAWESACQSAGLTAIRAGVDRALGALAGGRAVESPVAPDGRPYLPMTLRHLPVGGLLPPHCGNEQMGRPPFGHLNTLVDGETQLSFFLTLSPAAAGGELVIHDLGFGELDEGSMYRGHIRVAPLLAGRSCWRFSPGPGDLLIFDGGRIIHQIAPVRGGRDRWTLGGFMAMDPSGSRVYRWG